MRTRSLDEVRRTLALASEDSLLHEAVEATLAHFLIAERFVEATNGTDISALLTGSSAWGAFNAVRNDPHVRSDIDLLVAAETMDELETALSSYIAAGLVGAEEARRFEAFRQLHEAGMADHFSLISSYDSVPVSVDMLLWRHVDAISKLSPMREAGGGIRTIRELRTNPPKREGYTLDDLRTGARVFYRPRYILTDAGYLADTLVDASSPGTYHLGVMGFFLGVEPYIIVDENGRLRAAVDKFQTNIATLVNRPQYITREERMAQDIAHRAKTALSKERAPYQGDLELI